MRRVDTELKKTKYQIRGFKPGLILINDQEYSHSLIVTPNKLITDWPVPTHDELTIALLEPIITLRPDVLLLGTGAKHHFMKEDLSQHLVALRIGVEVMSTAAACRTFNALSHDGRHVAAALIIN